MDKNVRVITEYKSGRTMRSNMTTSEYVKYKEETLRNENIEDVRLDRSRK